MCKVKRVLTGRATPLARVPAAGLLLCCGLLAAASLPTELAAQHTPEDLRARLDSLAPLLQSARHDFEARNAQIEEARRRAAAAATRVDTVRIGQLTVLTPSGQGDETRELFAEVWEDSFAHLGHSPALSRSVFSFQLVSDEPLPIHMEGGGHVLNRDNWVPRARVKADVRRLIAGAMSHDLRENRSHVGGWLRGNALDPLPWADAYRQVATTSSIVTRACLSGDAEACGSAMALETAFGRMGPEYEIEVLADWYTPEERRALVATRAWFSRRAQRLRARCVVDNDVSACDEYLLEFGYDWTPLGIDVRETLVAFALDRGGEGAWGRLVEQPEMTPAEALEYASGQPVDELLEGWRAELLAHRPETFEPLVPGSGRALLWTLLFAALAMRSTRWRLG